MGDQWTISRLDQGKGKHKLRQAKISWGNLSGTGFRKKRNLQQKGGGRKKGKRYEVDPHTIPTSSTKRGEMEKGARGGHDGGGGKVKSLSGRRNWRTRRAGGP